MTPKGPSKILLRIFRSYCDPLLVDHIEGDLIETFCEWSQVHGRRMANMRLAIELVLLFRPGIIRPWRSPVFVTTTSMYKSFIVVAWRNFLRNRGYSTINIFGLAIALSACLVIFLYVRHEMSYDRFYEHADRIVRVNSEIRFGDNHIDLASASPTLGYTAKSEFPQIEHYTRIRWHENILVRKDGEMVNQGNVAFADSTLFSVFTLPVLYGDPATALSEPNSIVLTEALALKYFGRTDVLGKMLSVAQDGSRKVTAVIKNIPDNSHFHFTSFVPLIEDQYATENTWAGSQNYNTYFLLRSDVDLPGFTKLLNDMQRKHLEPELKTVINKTVAEFESTGDFFRVNLTPLTDIHLHSQRTAELYGSGKIEYVYGFSAIAIFILIIAIINFMNLATARSANRAREVGVRKVLGSLKTSLVQQFILESTLTCALSMVIALAITAILLPQFNTLTGKSFQVTDLFGPPMPGIFAVMIVLVGLLSGSYPAFYLSAFQPVAVLKGSKSGARRSGMRNILVVFQFGASVTLIAGTIVIYMQMDYMRDRDLGYNREQILVLNNASELGPRIEPLKNTLLSLAGVERATISGYLPVSYNRSNNTFFRSPTLDISGAESMQAWWVDHQYISTMSMEIVQGRDFSRDIASDSAAVILNESAARFLGERNIIGMKLYTPDDMERKTLKVQHVIGIVKDFNFSTLRDQVSPLALMYGHDHGSIALKLHSANIPAVVRSIETKWKFIAPEIPFEYSFMDEDYNRLYEGDRQVGKLITTFASLSIFISCLGLFGLAAFMAEQRSKEIGIRKVMGASVYGITSLLSKDFLRLVLLAVLIAAPFSWYLISKWLEEFAYHVDISWWTLPLAGIVAVVIAFLTVGYQSVTAAIANPVVSLRAE